MEHTASQTLDEALDEVRQEIKRSIREARFRGGTTDRGRSAARRAVVLFRCYRAFRAYR